jgi:hypothetical protein
MYRPKIRRVDCDPRLGDWGACARIAVHDLAELRQLGEPLTHVG